jgi:hypothetical protein
MLGFFPLGAIHWTPENQNSYSYWRELEFGLLLLRQAIMPELNLDDCLKNWSKVCQALADSPRKRKKQHLEYF